MTVRAKVFGSTKLNTFHFSPPWSKSLLDGTNVSPSLNRFNLLQYFDLTTSTANSTINTTQFASITAHSASRKSHTTHRQSLSKNRSRNNNTQIQPLAVHFRYILDDTFSLTLPLLAIPQSNLALTAISRSNLPLTSRITQPLNFCWTRWHSLHFLLVRSVLK